MANITRDQILALAAAPATHAVDIPELGGQVWIRPLTVGQVLELSRAGATTDAEALPRMIVMVVCDETGARLFTDADLPALADLPVALAGRIMAAIQRFGAMDAAAGKAGGAG